jgi:hypothetical protein
MGTDRATGGHSMKLALIPPLSHLSYSARCTTHLLLSHLMDNTETGHRYTAWYRELHDKGDYLILDNAAHELDKGEGIAETLRKAMILGGVNEIVVPDKQQDGALTVEFARRAARYLETPEGTNAYLAAGKPRLMYVPQGLTYNEWVHCYMGLMDVHRSLSQWGLTGLPMIGLAKKHALYFPFKQLLSFTGAKTDVHLLGWPGTAGFIDARKWGHVRSMDTARPFVYAIAGIKFYPGGIAEGAHRPVDYFRTPHDLDLNLLEENIRVTKLMCQDREVVPT